MKDVLVTIIFLWVLYKIFGGRTVVHRYTVNQHHTHTYDRSKEGEVKVEKKTTEKDRKLNDKSGEYVDYEEVK
jgi:hypothetical protein